VEQRSFAILLMLASGFAGLGYQIVWTQQAALLLGHEAAAVLAVVTAFFGGLALGGWGLGRRIEVSARPRRWYVAAELTIAAYGLLLLLLWRPLGELVLGLTPLESGEARQWFVAFGATFLLLLPASVAMGTTLPAMERLLVERRSGRSLSMLYAYNTLGAVLGVLVTAGWSLAELGLTRTVWLCAGCNALCAALALRALPEVVSSARATPELPVAQELKVGWRLAVTGLLGIGYEVVVVRVLSQVTEDTVYTFAALLAVYLLGTAAGAAAYRRWLERGAAGIDERLLGALAMACLLGALSLWEAERVSEWALEWLGGGLVAALLHEALLAVLAFALPTVAMGALFAHLTRDAHLAGLSFGRALGLNTLAGAAAPLLFGVFVVPSFGPKIALLLLSASYLALVSRRAWYGGWFLVPAAGVALTGLLAPPLRFVEVPTGGRVLSYAEGVTAAVSVVEDADGVARLRINNRQQEGSSASLRVDARQAWLPLLLHPQPRRALFLGLGTGVTATSAAADPTLHVDAVELIPEVVEASRRFADGEARQRLHVVNADARRFVRSALQRYDVIVADNFHPARAGTAALYTVEHFSAVRERLAPDGVFCQWLPLHQLDLDTTRSIARSFLKVYPAAVAILASSSLETPVVGLVARRGEPRFDLLATHERVQRLALAEQVTRLGLEDEYAVLGSVIADAAALARFAGAAPLNTDDRPLVAYRAPRVTYAPDSSPAERLLALLHQLSATPEHVVLPVDTTRKQRLASYWLARDRFIESGQNIKPTGRVREMLAQVQEPLLSVLRTSPDFRPAYDPLVSMAAALSRSDAAGARALLSELSRIQPSRGDAAQILATLGGDTQQR
jgi:spermidine synthase